ncbi:MAG: efflux RND transporter permease subunit, partial [Candidatus Accumulibacter sp.]|nr:efflux RND transporter permease subunit [Accumulibacter sp.]
FNEMDEVVEGIVLMRRGGNATEMLNRVRARIQEINTRGLLPEGLKIIPFYDRQSLLDLTTNTVKHSLFFGISLVLVVLYAFLGSFRAAITVAAIIPLALCASFIGMNGLGVPANLISLGAIDFGLIVNAAVIVIENIMRRIEEHSEEGAWSSVVVATEEIQRAMIFSTLIVIVAYSPLFIMGGVEGKIFRPMAYTMGIALMASIILSLTVIPSASYVFFKDGSKAHFPGFVNWMLKAYRPALTWLMARPISVLCASILIFCFSLLVGANLGTSFLPALEENNLWIRITLPNTVDLSYSSQVAKKIRTYLTQQPEVNTVATQIGRPDDGTDATGVFNLEFATYFRHPDQWPAGSTRPLIVERVEKELKRIPGINYSFSQYIQDNVNEALSGVKGENSLKLFGDDLEVLNEKAIELQEILKSVQGVAEVGIFRELGQPTLNISIDRAKASRFGVNVADIDNLVQHGLGGNAATSVLEGERVFDLTVRYTETHRENVERIRNLLLDTPGGQRIPLSMVASVEVTDGPFFIYRERARRYIAIKFSVRGRDLGSAVAEAQSKVRKSVEIPRGYRMTWDGQFNQMKEAQKKLIVIIPITLLVIFLLLYSTFGNGRDAGLVLLNVPFAAIGGIATLFISGEELSISAGIGFLSLFGIAIQDSVILISYISKILDETTSSFHEAVIEGSSLCLRPVLMTALLASFGLLPAALTHAIGSQAQRPLALVIVGGMVTTTLFTLLVLPVIFAWVRGDEKTGLVERLEEFNEAQPAV